jgi:branched-chain amino acid aminotransferase
MGECAEKQFILNGNIKTAEIFDDSLVYKGNSVYEVIRTVGGTPLFFNDHMERLQSSIILQGKRFLASTDTLRHDILLLSEKVDSKEKNLKIVFNYNNGSENYLIYFIESVYPTETQYNEGVKAILFRAVRRDPESKVINNELRTEINRLLKEKDAYEALLVNKENSITEGSRSNVFFLKNDLLVTAPDNVILKGITRKYILEICNEINIRVDLRCVDADKIGEFDAVFMTGTSPMVLPYCCIETIKFNPALPVLNKLRALYMKKAEESLRLFKKDY